MIDNMSIRYKLNSGVKKLEKTFEVYNELTISEVALLNNYDVYKKLTNKMHIFPVLKSNAYGHGIKQVTEILKKRSFPYIAVDGYFERLAIKDISNQPVLVMGAIKPVNYKNMDFKNTAFVLHDLATLIAIGKTNRKAVVHIEIDTGMSRHGLAIGELDEFLITVKKFPNINVEGLMSHLADADNPDDDSFTKHQSGLFDMAVEKVRTAGFEPKYIHIPQSAGSTKNYSKYNNAIRLGIGLYGINPLSENDNHFNDLKCLRPALSLTSTITKIININEGTTVGYNRTFKAKKSTRIGVLPIGYYEGVPRQISNTGLVQYGEKYFNIAGRVCMNHTMIELTDKNVQVGDSVTIISDNPESKVSVSAICQRHNLFSYSLLTSLNESIRRKVTK